EPVLRAEATAALDYELALLQLLDDLHSQDEEKSLFPRLRANLAGDSSVLREVFDALDARRAEKDAVFEELAACIRDVSSHGGQPAADQLARLEMLVDMLADLFRPHVASANDALAETCRRHLTEADLQGLQRAMRARFNG